MESKKDLLAAISADAIVAGVPKGVSGWAKRIIHPQYCYNYIKRLRKADFYINQGGGKKWYGKLLLLISYRKAKPLGFYIPRCVFGKGLYLPHFGSIVIHPNSKIGDFCQINNNVVIGQVHGKCPMIGNNVFIGAGAVICGEVEIADNVWVGANSIVTKSIKQGHVLVAGSPAKVICEKPHNWVEEFQINI